MRPYLIPIIYVCCDLVILMSIRGDLELISHGTLNNIPKNGVFLEVFYH